MAQLLATAQTAQVAFTATIRRKGATRAMAARPPRPSAGRRARAVRVQAAATATADVGTLNAQFGKAAGVAVVEGRGGLPTVTLKHACGSAAEVTLFGGCVTSWKTAEGLEVLYIRPDAVFDKSKPISGGIPHCFPQFGPGPMQLHGFARNSDWTLVGAGDEGGRPYVTLELRDNDYTRGMWPAAFRAEYTVTLDGETLRTKLAVHNTGDKAFEFNASLHSYFGVEDVETAKLRGLEGLEYLDRVADAAHPSVHKELRELVTFRGPVDSVYRGVPGSVALDNGKGTVALASSNWPDVVVWTPWTAMEACYKEFVCVENAQFGSVSVAPGKAWAASTAFSFSRDPLEQFCGDNPDAEECRVYED